jgi:glycosyltransferase involved in cell wall biosynthesis
MSEPRRKLLIVSYLFPPAGGITVQRALSFAKYLPQHGWDVHVLKAWDTAAPVRDPGLLAQLPDCVTVHEAFTPEIPFAVRQKLWSWMNGRGTPRSHPSTAPRPAAGPAWPARLAKRILCPEPEIVWVPFALRKASQIVRRYAIDTVLVTVPPFSALLVGSGLKQRFPHIQLVSDFRDEWLTFYLKDFEFQTGDYTRRRAEQIERTAIEASDLVVAVTPSSLKEIRNRYPEQPDRKFACIYNGYDPDVFRGFTPRPHNLPGKIVVTHMGTVYKTATPKYYLDALDALPEEIRSRFETRFIGRISESEKAVFEGRKSNIRLLGFMPQAEALRWVEETDYLLLTMTDPISLPGKLFEYLATGKPVLAITPPDSEVDRVVRAEGVGVCASPADRAGLTEALWLAARSCERPFRHTVASSRFTRPALTAELHSVLAAGVENVPCLAAGELQQ